MYNQENTYLQALTCLDQTCWAFLITCQ